MRGSGGGPIVVEPVAKLHIFDPKLDYLKAHFVPFVRPPRRPTGGQSALAGRPRPAHAGAA